LAFVAPLQLLKSLDRGRGTRLLRRRASRHRRPRQNPTRPRAVHARRGRRNRSLRVATRTKAQRRLGAKRQNRSPEPAATGAWIKQPRLMLSKRCG